MTASTIVLEGEKRLWGIIFDSPKHYLFLVHFCTVSVMLKKKIIPFTVLDFL